uniref:Membrane protein, putative n=1 Tax=Babesia bovis TaxID=5865 RepID=S6B350_BABBO|nr:membrane protein, putative [Babesia bovis]
MSGHLVCKSGFGLGKVAKLMLASVVVLSAFSGNVWANEAEVPQEPVEKKKEGDSEKSLPANLPSVTTSNNKVKTPLKDFPVELGPAQNSYIFGSNKGEVDLATLKDRISLLLNIVTNYGPETPGFGISENIVELFNNKGTIVVPEDIARDLCSLPTGKMKLYVWEHFTGMFARFIATLVTVNAYGDFPKGSEEQKQFMKDLGIQNLDDYYKGKKDSYGKIRKHVLSALTRKPGFGKSADNN